MQSVVVEHISKSYEKAKQPAVHDVSFSINKGELFGLIGPDGAGKTSIFRMLTTLLLPDAGHATVDGYDIVKITKRSAIPSGTCPVGFHYIRI